MTKFIKKLDEDAPAASFDAGDVGAGFKTLGAVPGMGTAKYATRDGEGSGDVPTPRKKKKKKKKKKVNEQDMSTLLGADPKKLPTWLKKKMKHLKAIEEDFEPKKEVAPQKQTNMFHCDAKSCDHYRDAPGTTNCILKEISISSTGACNQYEPVPKKEEPVEKLEEDLGNGQESFQGNLKGIEVTTFNLPPEWSGEAGLMIAEAQVDWDMELDVNKMGLEDFIATINRIYITGEIDMGENNEPWQTELKPVEEMDFNNIEIEKGKFPIYVNSIELDMNSSTDKKEWKLRVKTGS